MGSSRRNQILAITGLLLLAAGNTIAPLHAVFSSGRLSDTREVTIVSAASLAPGPVAPEAIAAAFGTQLATTTLSATDIDSERPGIQLPNSIGGTTVEVNGRAAPLLFVSPSQVNFLIPLETEIGAARIVVRAGDGLVAQGAVEVKALAPSIFTVERAGRRAPAGELIRIGADGVQSVEPLVRPASTSPTAERLILAFYLTGIRHARDPNGDGNLNETVKVVIGGELLTPLYSGLQGDYAGLDQINVEIPLHLAGRGHVHLAVTAEGSTSNLAEMEIGTTGIVPPQVNGFSPASLTAGQMLTINGSGFAPGLLDNVVRIGGIESRVIAADASQLIVIVPFGAASGTLTVQTAEGTATSSSTLSIRTSLSGVVETTSRQPLAGVIVRIVNRNVTATTNGEGLFQLTDAPSGPALLEVDGGAVASALAFPRLALRVNILSNRDNLLPRPLALQPVTGSPLATGAANPSVREIQTPAGSISFELPPNTSSSSPEGEPAAGLSFSLVEGGRTPVALPAGRFSPLMAQIAPFGASITPGGRLSFPNTEGLPAGAQVPLFRFDQQIGNRYDPTTTSATLGQVVETGAATVSADGRRIETAAQAIKEATCYFVAISQQTTTVIGRVVESDGTTPVRQATVIVRGQEAISDGNGGFTVREVPVKSGDRLDIEVVYLRPQGRVERTVRSSALAVVAGTTEIAPEIVLPGETSNRPPVLLSPGEIVANQGETRDFPFSASDPDFDQAIEVSVSGAPFATIKPAVGPHPYQLRLAPGPDHSGGYGLLLTARDELGASTTREISIVINRRPVVLGQTLATDEDAPLQIRLSGSDADGDAIAFAIESPPQHGRIDGAGPNLTYIPAADYHGSDSFVVKATDGAGASDPAQVWIVIRPVNDKPVLTLPQEVTAVTGETLLLTITAFDPDLGNGVPQTLEFFASGLPGGARLARINDTSAQLSWTPGALQTGTHLATVGVKDDGVPSLTDQQTIALTTVGRWRPAGVMEGGTILPLYSHASRLFAGTQGGGIFRWNEQDENWAAVYTAQLSDDVRAFAALGTQLFAAFSGTILRSTDAGESWQQTGNGNFAGWISSLTVVGTNLIAGVYGAGVYRSLDGGASWSLMTSTGLTDRRIFMLAVSGGVLIAATESGLFRSTDEGRNWAAAGASFQPNTRLRALIANAANIFTATDSGVYRSSDQGQSWSLVLSRCCIDTLAIDETRLVATSCCSLFAADLEGRNWIETSIENPLNVGMASTILHGGGIFVGTYGGGAYRLAESAEGGGRWRKISSGLHAMQVRAVAFSETTIVAGTLGSGALRSLDGGRSWVEANSGLTASYINALLAHGGAIYAGTNGGVFVSTDEARGWRRLNSWPGNSWVSALEISGGRLYAATYGNGIYRSTDGGQNWSPANEGLSDQRVLSLASFGNRLFAGTDGGGAFMSVDQGASWAAINRGLTNLQVSALSVAGNLMFAATLGGGVHRSIDGGQNWAPLDPSITGTYVELLRLDGPLLLAGNGGGVYLSTDQGRSWMRLNAGLTNLRVGSIALSGRLMVLGTYGSGVFIAHR